jgi:ferredoxin--NADP+ reductase
MPALKVAVVGAGPGGFYAAGALLKQNPDTEVSLIERLPAPYGLVRYGVAPDHPSLKTVTSLFERTGRDPRVTFFGNTQLWRDASLAELLTMHHAVILAIGAPRDRMLGLIDDEVESLYRASQIVGWYNSDPDQAHFTPHFGRGRVCVFGHGNVAADITRILLSPPERLRETDISERALEVLQQKPVREVHLVGRRGPAETRFTPPVITELLELPGVEVIVDAPDELMAGEGDFPATHFRSPAAREVMRILRNAVGKSKGTPDRRLWVHFGSRPETIFRQNGLLHISLLHTDGSKTSLRSLQTDAAISAAGFQLTDDYCDSLPLTGGALSNRSGQLIDADGRLVSGVFTVGWAARGAAGTIGTCRSDAERLVQTLLADAHSMTRPVGGRAALMATLIGRHHQPVTFEQWLQLDRLERANGATSGRSRLKVPTSMQMLAAMNSFTAPDRIERR